MSCSSLLRSVCSAALVLGFTLAPAPSWGLEKFGGPEFTCVGSKQEAAARYCHSALTAWSGWELQRDDARRDRQLAWAETWLGARFFWAEVRSAIAGVDCVEQTATAADLADSIDEAVSDLVSAINTGLDLGHLGQAWCGARLVKSAANACLDLLTAEGHHTRRIPDGGDAAGRDAEQREAREDFSAAWARAACPTTASESDIESRIDSISDDVVFQTVVSPVLDDSEFQPVSPVGPIAYEGRTLEPRCGFDDDPDYHFFVKRGSVNKLVMYYQGGGACWTNLTCSIPVCKDGADPVRDDPDGFNAGFGDLTNPDNPFKDWNAVFVTYCTCDLHFGDVDQSYGGFFPDVRVSHRGFQNAKVAEKFAREHFLSPEVVFVTGSSAGGYGAQFHGPLLHEVWPLARFHVLGDASSGVITSDFLQNELSSWNFEANLPDDIPGVLEAITGGEGMVAFIEAVANVYRESNWAHYSTAYDGGSGGQSGFYNVMINNSSPVGAATWWNGSCRFNELMVDQSAETFSRVPTNYRFYIGAGSRHTMYGSDKVYTDQTGGESQTIVDWINDMISYEPGLSSASDWQNVQCEDCEIVLPDDPTPPFLPLAPYFPDGMGGSVIECPSP